MKEHLNNKINDIIEGNMQNTYIILDGVINTNKVFEKDNSLKEIHYNGKHYFITSIIALQYPFKMPPEYSANFDYIILFNLSEISYIKIIYTYYVGMIPTFEIFYKFFKEFTSDHGCIIIDRSTPNDIFWYRPESNNH